MCMTTQTPTKTAPKTTTPKDSKKPRNWLDVVAQIHQAFSIGKTDVEVSQELMVPDTLIRQVRLQSYSMAVATQQRFDSWETSRLAAE